MSSFEYGFWAKANKSGDCWEWTAAKNHLGYGYVKAGGKMKKAHRLAYEFDNGPIPEGLVIDHVCHNPGCVKPAHLRAATQKQNGENLAGVHSNNVTSGVRGVYAARNGKWQARVTHHGKIHTAGTHTSVAEAEAAIIALRNRLFTHNDVDRRDS